MEIEIKKVNQILKQLCNVYNYNFKSYLPSGFTVIAEQKGEYWKQEVQGEEGEYHYILQYESYFIKVTCYSNSYGNLDDNKKLIQFVTPTTKTVTDYSAI